MACVLLPHLIMPGWLHEGILLLFRNQPRLAPDLMAEVLGVDVPPFDDLRVEDAELTTLITAEYRADLVVLLIDGKPVFGIVLEVQLRLDAGKHFQWPAYLSVLRSRHACPCAILVVTPDEKVADWARQPIPLGPGSFVTPLVIGPSGVPVITDRDRALQSPEAAVLSAMAHGAGDVATAVEVALTAAGAARDVDEATRVLYLDLIEAALGDAARKAFTAMIPEGYEYQGPTFKKAHADGQEAGRKAGLEAGRKAGLEAGRFAGHADAVLEALEVRGFAVSEDLRAHVRASRDLNELRRWLRSAITAASVDEVFGSGQRRP